MRWESRFGAQSAGVLRAVFDGLISSSRYMLCFYGVSDVAACWNPRGMVPVR